MAMGALSKQEIEEEFKFLNPKANKMATAMKKVVGIKT